VSETASRHGAGGGGQADRYLLGDSTAEVEHLTRQADVYAAEAAQLLDLAGPATGASAIDVGCGALTGMAKMWQAWGTKQ
jgi:hypothetical protein